MNEAEKDRLLRDVLEQNPKFMAARESAWRRVWSERQRRRSSRIWRWVLSGMAAGLLVASGFVWRLPRMPDAPKVASPDKLERAVAEMRQIPVEIGYTKDIPHVYVEVNDQELHVIFPKGLLVALGDVPSVTVCK